MIKSSRLYALISTFCLTLAAGMPASADDTEIYLGAQDGSAIKHNILFILDTSFSMDNDVKVDNNGDGDTNDPGENLGSRISILQDAMTGILSGLDNVRVGMMRMNGAESPTKPGTALACEAKLLAAGGQTYINQNVDAANIGKNIAKPEWSSACYVPTGGPVLFPIADIDADISTVAGETAVFDLVVPLISGSDDAEQLRNFPLSTVTTSTTLNLAHAACPTADIATNTYPISAITSSDDVEEDAGIIAPASSIDIGTHPTGFRFQNVLLPDSAAILGAKITFTANAGGSEDLNLSISGGINADSATTFANIIGQKVSDRAITTATADWTGVPAAAPGDTLDSSDLSAIVQELVDDAANWDETGDSLVFLIDSDAGNSGRNIHDVSSDPTKRASLEIKHCNSAAPVSAANSRNYIGLRFQNVGIPQGAKINSAFIDFVAANPVSNVNLNNGVDDDVHIHAQLSDTPATFADGVQFSNRSPLTNRVDWEGDDMGVWVEGDTYTTPDLKDIVDDVVDLGSWCGGDDMAFIIEGDANLLIRAASAFEDDPSKAPVLRVQYENIFTGGDTGCNVRTYSVPIAQGNHDARTNNNAPNGSVNTNSTGMPMGFTNATFFNITVGLIFKVPVLEDTVINSARLEFTATNDAVKGDPASADLVVNAEANLNATNFSTSVGDLSTATRPRITGTGIPIAWSQPPVANNASFGIDVTPLVKAVTEQTGWAYDNQMAFFITDGPSPNNRQADSWNGSPSTAPRLILNVQENTATITAKTVRERLLEINETFTVPNLLGWTPSVETLYEAARYWRGKGVEYGKSRGAALIDTDGVVENVLIGRSQNPDLIQNMDFKKLMHRTLTSHPGSYTGGTYVGPVTNCIFSHDPSCVQDKISGTPVYISPIDTGLECAGNFQIFLTDGAPTFTNQATEDLVISEFADIASCSTVAAINAKGEQGRCAVEMAASLRNNDQSALHDGNQTITSYTIAFNLNDANGVDWLKQIAAAGDGKFFSANSAADLLTVFGEIFNDIVQRPTSFVAPSIAANAFNRLFSRNEVYFGLFEPNQLSRWDGNVKKYRICDTPDFNNTPGDTSDDCTLGDVLDTNNLQAVDTDGLFKGAEGEAGAAQSVWSNIADGKTIRSGGAGGEVTNISERTIYTELDASNALPAGTMDADGFKITSSNLFSIAAPDLTHIHNAVCPTLPADLTAGSDCANRMLWMLGTDTQDEDGDLNLTELRWWHPDVLHSSPIAVTYGIDDGGDGSATPATAANDKFIDKILVGTNDGGLHMINGETGLEDWVFIPAANLPKQVALFDNNTGGHTYGLDATPLLRIVDRNNNGIIEPNATPALSDRVIVYIAQRRGGNTIYALDITPPSTVASVSTKVAPKFLWSKTLTAQSWSEPALATIQTVDGLGATVVKDVLIFGGGYDENLDGNFGLDASTAPAANLGNSIYIVEADSGDTILEISNDINTTTSPDIDASTTAHIKHPKMVYSIPSNVTVFDSTGNGFEDRIYVGDTAGQVWRVDLGDDIKFVDDGDPTTNLPGSTVLGLLASIASDGGTAATTLEERRFFYKPSVVQVVDTVFSTDSEYDYVIIPTGDRASPIDRPVQDRIYAFRDYQITKMSGDASNLATTYPLKTTSNNPVAATDMIDVTQVILDPVANPAVLTSLGWYYSFDINGATSGDTGEKGLAAPTVIAGTLITTSYVPDDPSLATACGAVEGSGRAYNFNILSAGAALDWDGTAGLDGITDRIAELGAGIPSEAVPIFTKEGVTVLVGTGGGAENLGTASSLPRYRTYWAEDLPSS